MFGIFYKPEALEDISDACEWYNAQQSGLGERFLDELDDVLDYLEMNPYLSRKHFGNIHEATMKIFPFVVIYKIEAKQVIVFSVFNCHQNPNKIKKIIK